jgi:hypothetical protein
LGAFVAAGARENLREMVGHAGKRLSEATRKTFSFLKILQCIDYNFCNALPFLF